MARKKHRSLLGVTESLFGSGSLSLRLMLGGWGSGLAKFLLLYTVLYVAWILHGPTAENFLTDRLFDPIVIGAAALLWRNAREMAIRPESRRAWTWIAAAYTTVAIGDFLWSFELALGRSPFGGWSDVGYLPLYPLCFIGILAFPTERAKVPIAQLLVDLAIVLAACTGIFWFVVLGQSARPISGIPSGAALAVVYPVLDVVLITTIGYVLLRRPSRGIASSLSILASSLQFQLVFDLYFAARQMGPSSIEPARGIEALWVLARGFVILAAHVQFAYAKEMRDDKPIEVPLSSITTMPHIAVLIAFTVLVFTSIDHFQGAAPIVIIAIALSFIIVLRIYSAMRRSERLIAERVTEKGEQKLRSLVDHSHDTIAVIDDAFVFRFVSPSIYKLLGFQAEELLDKPVAGLIHEDDRERALSYLGMIRAFHATESAITFRVRRKDGSWTWVESVATNQIGNPDIQGIVINSRDVSEKIALQDELIRRAFEDTLTGLPNRAMLHDRLGQLLGAARRRGVRVSVLFLDLDDFKRFNDSLGHAVGDAVLLGVAKRLTSCIRSDATLARMGGDEFGILLESSEHAAEEAVDTAERIISAMRAPIDVGERSLTLTLSIGIAIQEGDDPDELLRNADVALYRAKATGPGSVVMFRESMYQAVRERLELEHDLRTALERHELRLAYQPIVDLVTGQISGVEALIRWRHPKYGDIPPSTFVPLAEHSGLIRSMGHWTQTSACRQLHQWKAAGLVKADAYVSVNVSVREIRDESFVSTIEELGSMVSTNEVVLEFTESVLLDHTESNLGKVDAIRASGLRTAIDDFGTGYSSFGYLQRFPFDIVKIDRSFIDGILTDSRSFAVTGSIISLTDSLGMMVVSEGIEKERQREVLLNLGCTYGQGFLFSAAREPGEMDQILRSWSPTTAKRHH